LPTLASGHSSFFAERRRKDENKKPRTIQRHEISKVVSATTALARSDARVQHRNIQFGKRPGIHLQFASAARERLVIKRAIYTGYMFARHIKPKKIVFHTRPERHETGGMNRQKIAEDSQVLPRKPSRSSGKF
jgi:hypothetical protein